MPRLKKFDKTRGYQHKSVLKLELEGANYIKGLMDMLWVGIHGHQTKAQKENPAQRENIPVSEHRSNTPFGRYIYGRISENYRLIFEDPANTLPTPYTYYYGKSVTELGPELRAFLQSTLPNYTNEILRLLSEN